MSDATHLPEAYYLSVDGKALRCAGEEITVINPATEQPVGQCPMADRETLELAISSAKRAFPAWNARPWAERGAALKSLAKILREHRTTLSELLVSEQGKPRVSAEWEIDGSADWLDSISSRCSRTRRGR